MTQPSSKPGRNIKQAVREFFRQPVSYSRLPKHLKVSGERSTLFLLRRDLQDLYLKERQAYPTSSRKIPSMLATSGILVGIDLMAKFHSPKAKNNSSRFLSFLRDVPHVPDWQGQFLWDLRNALMHSYSFTIERGPNVGKFIRFSSGPSPSQEWVVKMNLKGRQGFDFFFWEFKDFFRATITTYQQRMRQFIASNPASQECVDFLVGYEEFGLLNARTERKKQESGA